MKSIDKVGHKDFTKFAHSFKTKLYERLASGKCLAFWANDFDPTTKIHHGNKIATTYNDNAERVVHDKEVLTLSAIEARSKGRIIALDEIEGDAHKSSRDKQLMCALSSYAFATSASDTILCSTKGASPKSYFRNVELDVVMSNEKVGHIVIANRDVPQGVKYAKRDGYHEMRSQWVDESIKRVTDCHKLHQSAPDNPAINKAYNQAVDDLASELALARKMQKTKYPFRAYDALAANEHTEYNISDIAKEQSRIVKLEQCAKDLGVVIEVEAKVETIRSAEPRDAHIVEEALSIAKHTQSALRVVSSLKKHTARSRLRRSKSGSALDGVRKGRRRSSLVRSSSARMGR